MLDTQRPFDASSLILEDEVSALVQNAHDPVRNRASEVSPPRRDDNLRNLAGAASGTHNDKQPLEEDTINPSHYRKHPSGIECIEVTRHMNFNVGNAIKYLWRYMDKGDPIENLKKAQWYISDEIARLEGLR